MCMYAIYNPSGTYSSVVRVSASGGGGPGFNPHHIKLSGLEVRTLKVSGGSPVHLRSKHRATGSRTWKEDSLGQKTKNMYAIYNPAAEAWRPDGALNPCFLSICNQC